MALADVAWPAPMRSQALSATARSAAPARVPRRNQLFYGLRPIVMREHGKELKIGNFTSIITDYEAEQGEIPGMYREPRGSIYHPHRGETITLGTLMVEEYERPEWTFNKLVYIEKEGGNEAFKEVHWGERHDCATMSSKERLCNAGARDVRTNVP